MLLGQKYDAQFTVPLEGLEGGSLSRRRHYSKSKICVKMQVIAVDLIVSSVMLLLARGQ